MPRRIERSQIPDGTVIERRYRGSVVRGVIFTSSKGKVGIEVGGVRYQSLTAGAKAVTGYRAINGWWFWQLDK